MKILITLLCLALLGCDKGAKATKRQEDRFFADDRGDCIKVVSVGVTVIPPGKWHAEDNCSEPPKREDDKK